jgi:hypothetical protein
MEPDMRIDPLEIIHGPGARDQLILIEDGE